MHAKLLEHSELIVHSGLQLGGLPTKLTKQEHEGTPPTSLHCELGPQGLGTQGLTTTGVGGSTGGAKIRIEQYFFYDFRTRSYVAWGNI
jgi:hypothetical protein